MPWIISTNLPWTFHSLILPIYPSSWVDLVSCAKFLGLSSNSFSALGLQQFLFERHIPSAWVCHRFETESLFFVYSLFSHPTIFKHWNSVWVHLSNHQRLQRKYHENTIQAVSQSALNKFNILVTIILNENRMLFFSSCSVQINMFLFEHGSISGLRLEKKIFEELGVTES